MTTPTGMQNDGPRKHRRMPLLLRLFLFSIGGLLVGIGVGVYVVRLTNLGRLALWKELEGPPRFKTIVDATTQAVVAGTIDGTIYQWNSNCSLEPECEVWVQRETLPVLPRYGGDMPPERAESCRALWHELPSEPPGRVEECVLTQTLDADFSVAAFYAVLEDGRILHWELASSMIFDIMLPTQIGCVAAVLGLGLGAISGILAKPPESR